MFSANLNLATFLIHGLLYCRSPCLISILHHSRNFLSSKPSWYLSEFCFKGTVSPDARVIAAAPHSSFMDAFIIAVIGPWTGVSRSENAQIPFFGNPIRLMQPTFVSRDDRNSKKTTIKEIKRRVHSKEWPPTLLFAEGTCTNRKSYTFFKPGAFYPGVPVQPVIVRYRVR